MSHIKKTWVDRVSEYPTRRNLVDSEGNTTVVTVERNEGDVTVEGDSFSAANMNDFENRINASFANGQITFAFTDDGKPGFKVGADSVRPFRDGGYYGTETLKGASKTIELPTKSNIKAMLVKRTYTSDTSKNSNFWIFENGTISRANSNYADAKLASVDGVSFTLSNTYTGHEFKFDWYAITEAAEGI